MGPPEVITIIMTLTLVLGLGLLVLFPEQAGEALMGAIDAWHDWVRRFNEGVTTAVERKIDGE